MNPLILKLLPYAIAAAVGFGGGWTVNGWRWSAKYKTLETQYIKFKGGVAAIGEQAKTRNAIQALNDLKAKEYEDENNRAVHAADRVAIKQLRDDRDRARRSPVPPAPAGSSRPDLLVLDRAEFERAHGEALGRLREGARGLADEGTAATIDLDTAKKWALKLSTTLRVVE